MAEMFYDDDADLSEAISEGLPSIIAQNAAHYLHYRKEPVHEG